MKSSNKALLLLGAAVLAVAIPALAQNRDAPESLLPEGFGDPGSLPPPEKAGPRAAPDGPSAPVAERADEIVQELNGSTAVEEDPLGGPRPTNYFSIPAGATRSTDVVGILEPGNFGLRPDAFGAGGGGFQMALMRQLDAPLPSRWTSILLRRALLSRLVAPAGAHPVNWVAERADLLLRMGEADAARMLVDSVDVDVYTPRMIAVAAQAALATADPSGLCPLVGPARAGRDAVWVLTSAMCAALEGEAARASALVDQARGSGAGGIDLMLAEKVIGAGGETRRAAAVVWDGVQGLNPWRLGLAGATGAAIPAPLLARAEPRLLAWYARDAMVPPEARVEAAATAAALGVFSSSALVELHSLIFDRADPAEVGETIAARLRTAWAAPGEPERIVAMRRLWEEPRDPLQRYARQILTAGAAARIEPSADSQADVADLLAAMLSAGLDGRASRWAAVAEQSGDQRAWALLATGAPAPGVDVSADRIEAYVDAVGGRSGEMLVAALAGLGRIGESDLGRLAGAAGIRLDARDAWGDALDAAARGRQQGSVALLAAVGMQTNGWGGVPPRNLYRALRALRAVGMDYEARMIAAEAIARL